MTETDPPRIYPTLRCRDAEAMIAFLRDAFGFVESFAHRENGLVEHAELSFRGGVVMLGQDRDDAYAAIVGRAGPPSGHGVYIAIEDPDDLCARAEAAGAEIVMPLSDKPHGSREFTCRDPEGNVWSFGTYRPGA